MAVGTLHLRRYIYKCSYMTRSDDSIVGDIFVYQFGVTVYR